MPENTLLSLLSGGRYGTSADLPTVPEMAHSYIDQIKESYDQQQQRDVQIQGQGLGLLDMVGGFSKAGALIPAGSREMVKFIKNISFRRELASGAKQSSKKFIDALKMTKGTVHEPVNIKELVYKHTQRIDEIKKVQGELQLYEEWLKLFGTGRAEALGKTEKALMDYIK